MAPKVLLVIEQCNPEWASVPLVGYNFYDSIRTVADVTLVTHRRNAEALLARHPDEKIEFIEEASWTKAWHPIAGRLSTISGKTIWPLYHTLTFPTFAEFNRKVAKRYGPRVRAGEFDVVHALTPMMPRYPYQISAYCREVPFVIGPVNGGVPYPEAFRDIAASEHGYLNILRDIGRWLMPSYRRTYERADLILSGSGYTKTHIEELFRLRRPVEIMAENGLPDSFFSALGERTPSETYSLLFVGRLVPYKGGDMAIAALAGLPPALRAKSRLTIVGDGPERAALEREAEALGVSDKVRFAGWVTHDETRQFYREADVFCFPSVREFGGAVVLEAMAHGVPCVVVDNGGIAEYVVPGTGITVPPLSRAHVVAETTKALVRLSDPELRRRMGDAAQAEARIYTWKSKARRFAAIYEKLCGSKRRAAAPAELVTKLVS